MNGITGIQRFSQVSSYATRTKKAPKSDTSRKKLREKKNVGDKSLDKNETLQVKKSKQKK